MKTYLFTFFAFFSILIGFAQDSTNVTKKSFDFGVRTGYNNYFIQSPGTNPNGSGYYAGLFIETSLSEKLALQVETNFNYSGSSILQLPVLFKYRINEKFEFYAGPQLDFSFEQNNLNSESRNKRWGASLILGAQYNIDKHWFIDARYVHGLADQFPIFQGFGVDPLYSKIRTFNLGLGFKF